MATVQIRYEIVQFGAHAGYHCRVINNNRYYVGLLAVAMATVVVDSIAHPLYRTASNISREAIMIRTPLC